MFCHAILEGRSRLGVYIVDFDNDIKQSYTLLKDASAISFIEATVADSKPIVFYKSSHDGKFSFSGFVGEGSVWRLFKIKDAEGLDVARMDYHVWDDKRILIIYSAEQKGEFRQRIYAALSNDIAKTWHVQRIDERQYEHTRSWLPRIAVAGEKVIAVWEDTRDIRAAVRIRLSPDRGKSWLSPDSGISDAKCHAMRPRVSIKDRVFWIAWNQFGNDNMTETALVLKAVTWEKALAWSSRPMVYPSDNERMKLLRQRANEYWKGMVEKDQKTTYELHDPFYKAFIPYAQYAGRLNPIKYLNFDLQDIKIEGNVATVKIKLTYEVPKIKVMETEFNQPPKEATLEDTYIFVDGTWYRRFVDALSGGSALEY
jgi:hypothetical protein